MTPTESSIRIMWQTTGFNGTCVVEIGPTSKNLDSKILVQKGSPIEGEGIVYQTEISNLQAFTKYYYRVGDGKTFSDVLETKTAPSKNTAFRLMALSDIHQNSGKVWENLSKRAVQDSLDMFVMIGDLVNYGNKRDAWDTGLFIPGRPLFSKVPFIGSIGNHETAFGPTTYFDYFSFPTHEKKDMESSSYFTMEYGDVRIIAINLNGDKFSPSFTKESPQYQWLDETIKNSTSKWNFIFSHVNVISTGTHGQWSDDQKRYVKPLLQQYASRGKNIIFFAGDEHNFEHLYTNGVNYFRPGAANASIRGQYNMVDSPYSLYFKKTNGYSIIDVGVDGSVIVTAKYLTGEPFYQARFKQKIQSSNQQERPVDISILDK